LVWAPLVLVKACTKRDRSSMQIFSLPVAAAAACALVLTGCGSGGDNPDPLQAGWDNHFGAFGEGVAAQDAEDPTQGNTAALDKIMLDYDENSVIRLYSYGAETPLSTHSGMTQIRALFDGFFPTLKGCNGAAANQLKAAVEVDKPGSQVFLVWKCESTGYYRATDTFIFEGGIIRNQNIVVSTTARAAKAGGDPLAPSRRLDYNPTTVSEAWTNHAEAFMAGAEAGSDPPRNQENLDAALDKIMLDYDANSKVRIFNFATDDMAAEAPFQEHTGPTEIRAMFDGLFKSFTSSTPPVVPLAEVVDAPKQVFLIWAAPDSGYLEATDTFIFDDNFKINRQNIAIKTAPAQARTEHV